MKCDICNEPLNDEERRSPEISGGWTMCDLCFSDGDWSHDCGLCGARESNDIPIFAVMIGSRAEETGAEPGIYQVLRWPWLLSSMLSQSVLTRRLLRVGEAPPWLEDGESLCRECALEAIVRRTPSGRWRVTTVRWHRYPWAPKYGTWRSKTRVYRTKALARRRARAYLYAGS